MHWPGAAARVADDVNLSTWLMFGSADKFMWTGVKMISDDVFPKLKVRADSAPLDMKAAEFWDARVISEEQHLTQPLHEAAKSGGYFWQHWTRLEGRWDLGACDTGTNTRTTRFDAALSGKLGFDW